VAIPYVESRNVYKNPCECLYNVMMDTSKTSSNEFLRIEMLFVLAKNGRYFKI